MWRLMHDDNHPIIGRGGSKSTDKPVYLFLRNPCPIRLVIYSFINIKSNEPYFLRWQILIVIAFIRHITRCTLVIAVISSKWAYIQRKHFCKSACVLVMVTYTIRKVSLMWEYNILNEIHSIRHFKEWIISRIDNQISQYIVGIIVSSIQPNPIAMSITDMDNCREPLNGLWASCHNSTEIFLVIKISFKDIAIIWTNLRERHFWELRLTGIEIAIKPSVIQSLEINGNTRAALWEVYYITAIISS